MYNAPLQHMPLLSKFHFVMWHHVLVCDAKAKKKKKVERIKSVTQCLYGALILPNGYFLGTFIMLKRYFILFKSKAIGHNFCPCFVDYTLILE